MKFQVQVQDQCREDAESSPTIRNPIAVGSILS
jgi:hypothetical protein